MGAAEDAAARSAGEGHSFSWYLTTRVSKSDAGALNLLFFDRFLGFFACRWLSIIAGDGGMLLLDVFSLRGQCLVSNEKRDWSAIASQSRESISLNYSRPSEPGVLAEFPARSIFALDELVDGFHVRAG